MNKFIKLALFFFFLFSFLGFNDIKANSYQYSCAMGFELSYINDDGSLSLSKCLSSFDEGVKLMKEKGDDYVLRHNSSLSATKIIAMNSGVIFAMPGRQDNDVINLYQDYNNKNSSYANTYFSSSVQMAYYSTDVFYHWDGNGEVKINLNGFDGYINLNYVDLVPMKYIEKNIPITINGNNSSGNLSYKNDNSYSINVLQNYFSVGYNGKYLDITYHVFNAYPDSNNYTKVTNYNYGKAADFMKANEIYYSNDGINYYYDRQLKNYAGKHYNYFMYLPVRSKTSISGETLNKYLLYKKGENTNSVMKNHGQTFIDAQNTYGVNATGVYALACLESAYGTSGYAINRANLFGWNAVDSNPDLATIFNGVIDAVNTQCGRNLRGYLDPTDYRYYGSYFGNKGSGFNVKYASDPFWGIKISAIMYDIDKFNNNYDGNLTDYGKYDIGLFNCFKAKYYKQASLESNVIDTSNYLRNYQQNNTVIILKETSNFYQVQYTSPIVNNEIVDASGLVPYDFNQSIAYVSKEHIDLIFDSDAGKEIGEDFVDIDESFNEYEAVLWMKDLNISTGFILDYQRYFKPYSNLKRIDVAAFIYRYVNRNGLLETYQPSEKAKTYFSDIKDIEIDSDHYKGLMWMVDNNITYGYNNNNIIQFKPYNNISRSEVAAFIKRLYDYLGYNINSDIEVLFDDVEGITHLQEVNWLAITGISKGYSSCDKVLYKPYNSITRGEFSIFLNRLHYYNYGYKDVDDNTSFSKEIAWLYLNDIEKDNILNNSEAVFEPYKIIDVNCVSKYLYNLGSNLNINQDIIEKSEEIELKNYDETNTILWLKQNNIWVENIEDGSVYITRQDLALILYNYYCFINEGYQYEKQTNYFNDETGILKYDIAITWLKENNITSGYENLDGSFSFKPEQKLSKCQMAAFLYRFHNLLNALN